jgi:flagellar basal-body rod protein FlgB
MSSTSLLAQLESYLTITNKRETVIAANMANIDTPGYQTQDINFQQALTRANDGAEDGQLRLGTHKVQGLLQRPDGNNVDLDRESMLLSESQLQYQLGTQLLKSRFHQLLSAINGGGQ